MFFLDTNVVVACLRGRGDAAVGRIESFPCTEIAIPYQVLAELRLGAIKSERPVYQAARVAAFLQPFAVVWPDGAALSHYVEIRAGLEKLGSRIGEADLWIAAVTRAAGAVLVSNNVGEFTRVPKLAVEDWLAV